MAFVHKHCGGLIQELWTKPNCIKCKKSWNPAVFWLDFFHMRSQVQSIYLTKEQMEKKLAQRHKKGDYASWADKLPGVGPIASILPHWSRRTRILVVLMIVIVLVGLLITYI
jgi:hypothetical protein